MSAGLLPDFCKICARVLPENAWCRHEADTKSCEENGETYYEKSKTKKKTEVVKAYVIFLFLISGKELLLNFY